MGNLANISPLDGRYADKIKELSGIFSEAALLKYRLKIEVEYLIALSGNPKIKELKKLNPSQQKKLRSLYLNFGLIEAEKIKKIEAVTNHDVKAVEYYLKEKVAKIPGLKNSVEFVHFCLTSEDVNNLSYSLMLADGVKVYQKQLDTFISELKSLAKKYQGLPMLALTHGQPATPTTLGKELAVLCYRLIGQKTFRHKLAGKFSGAVGNWNAQVVSYPQVDWLNFSRMFVESLGLDFNPLTTQIEPHDAMARLYHKMVRINNIIKNLDQDMWFYISRGIFKLKKKTGEVGSSTMPHKVNPIDFENSEGNLGLANAILEHLAGKLPISRLQRDLTDSTVLRNQGIALGYSLLALKMCQKGLSKLEVNKEALKTELNSHWEVLAEAIQVVLRKSGYAKPYEALKALTRGRDINQAEIRNFINGLKINPALKKNLLKLTPENYTGLALKLVQKYLK